MENSSSSATMFGAVEVKLMDPIFAGGDLPKRFAKHIRRPITNLPTNNNPFAAHRVSFNDSLVQIARFNPSQGNDSDEDCDGSEFGNNAATSRASVDGTAYPASFSPYTVNGSSAFRIKVRGGRAAVPKKIGIDLDSEDELIKQMKDTGETNDAIVKRLVERGGTKYDPKTIATRYARIKKTQLEKDEIRREDEFSDFHEDEDVRLLEAYEHTTTFFQKEIEQLEYERWKKVAAIVQESLGKAKYTGKACRNRVVSLKDGTGIIPLEQDPNHVSRTEETRARITVRLRIKAEERAQAMLEYQAKLKIKREQDAQYAREAQKRFLEQAERAAEIEELRLQKEAAAEARTLEREQKEALKEAAKLARIDAKEEAERQKRDTVAARAYEREHAKEARELQALQARLDKVEDTKKMKLAQLQEKQDTRLAGQIIRRVMRDAGLDTHAPLQPSTELSNIIQSPAKRVKVAAGATKKRAAADMVDDDDEETMLPIKKKAAIKTDIKANAKVDSSSVAAAPSPRATMTPMGLKRLCKIRKLNHTGRKEDFLRRLAVDDKSKSKEQLKQMLFEKKLSIGGSKPEMIKRLAEHDANAE